MNLHVGAVGPFTRFETLDALEKLPVNRHRFRLRMYGLLVLLDCAAIVCGFGLGNALRFGQPLASEGAGIATVMLPLYLALAANRGIYTSSFFRHWRQNTRRAAVSFVMAAFALLFVAFYLKAQLEMSRIVFTIGCTLAVCGIVGVRWVLHRYSTSLAYGDAITKVVICDGVEAPRDPSAITINAQALDLQPDSSDPSARDRLGRIVHYADRVVVACPDERREAWAAVLKGCGVQGEIVMHELAELGTLGATDFAGLPTLIVSSGPLSLRDRMAKRAIDIGFALSALLFLAPLMVLTAIAIKLETRGSALFVQPRMGRGNRLFPMYKFRSMRAELCDTEGRQSTLRGDPRITRIGRVIRATSVDELPQLINVLKGDMSIVGPRPHALGSLAGDKLFWEVDERYWNRHVAKPGITGLAQVRGFRGATHQQSDLIDRLQADLEYMNGWTIWRDFRILAATIGVVLHRNAY